ncbi:hypothetical protein Ancab_007354 [Ancistrocladus abbreviatus]
MKAMKALMLIPIIILSYYPTIILSSFDYLKLSVQWSPAMCNNKPRHCNKNKVSNNFNIHGLWPSNFSNPQPEYCDGATFDPIKVKGMQTMLLTLWRNLGKGKSDSTFWAHEWTKHGACFKQDQETYFKLVLDLHQNYVSTLYQKLINKGVAANSTNTYPLQKLNIDLRGLLNGKIPEITCTSWQSSGTQLAEIRICFSKDGRTIINCSKPPYHCNNNIYLLPSSTVNLMG